MVRRNHAQRIAAIVAKGRLHYMVFHGGLLWGTITAMVSALLMGFFNSWENFWTTLLISLIIYPIVGLVWGAFMFSAIERYHKRLLD